MATFGERFKATRDKAKLSQTDIALVCKNRNDEETSKAAVSNWETDKDRPSFDNLVAAARKMNVSIDYLVWGDEEQRRVRRVSNDAKEESGDYINAEVRDFLDAWQTLAHDSRELVQRLVVKLSQKK